jgi:extracellular matrix regulatory protein A
MSIQFVNVGFGSIVSTLRIIAIVSPDSAPIKRHVNEAKERGQSIDGTYGRKTRAVLIMDSGHVVLSAIQPETIASRAQGN